MVVVASIAKFKDVSVVVEVQLKGPELKLEGRFSSGLMPKMDFCVRNVGIFSVTTVCTKCHSRLGGWQRAMHGVSMSSTAWHLENHLCPLLLEIVVR
jgi:hypothetical protein